MSQTSENSWDGILANFLKAENLEEDEETLVCIGIEVNGKDVNLEIEKQGVKFLFSLNITNKVFLKENGITIPKEVIGKKLTLKKVLAMNPQLKKEVPSLRIVKVE
jgi:hypothetical protein